MKLERGDYGNPDISVLLPWAKVAKRIGYLIDNQQFLRSADYSRMPEYERERIAGKVISFYARLPEEIERPFKQDFFNEEARKELPVMLNDSEKSQKLLQAMDDALAMLPLDFESVNETYEKKLQLLTEVHQYVEGSYTIFPAQEVPDQADGLNGYQMSLFDIVSASEPEENTEEPEVEESSAEMEEVQKGEPESESVIVQEQWDENVFEYQGYHFEPVGILPQGLEGKELVNQTIGNTELHLTTYEREDDILYSYAGFYEASGSSKADIFRCMETGRNYIPGENELFGYEGEFLPYLQNEQVQEQEPHNFHITDDDLGSGGPKAKFKANMEAIRLLKELEQEQRLATPEEQEVLSRYVGWGGIPQAFEERNSAWAEEYTQLKGVLTPEEYSAARASTLNAFYTSPTVIKAMYEALGNMGLKQGNILEPSCGVGNFMGLLPENMSNANMYGVELDPVSGQIAKQLYQKNRIAVQGFEETSYPDSFFDCVIGNVPFGAYQVSDRKYDRYHL